jgi:hypothetical protein
MALAAILGLPCELFSRWTPSRSLRHPPSTWKVAWRRTAPSTGRVSGGQEGAGTVALITRPTGPANWTLGKDPGRNTDPEANGELDVYELDGEGTVVSRINYFFDWLNAGWKVSPVYDTDMHHSKWAGVEGPKTAGAWTKDGTWSGNQWPALRVAMRAHRTFANYPGKAKNYIRLVSLDAGGEPECMMGSTLPTTGEPLRLEITVSASQKQWHFRLFTNQKSAFGTPAASAAPADTTLVDGKEQRWRPTIDTSGGEVDCRRGDPWP